MQFSEWIERNKAAATVGVLILGGLLISLVIYLTISQVSGPTISGTYYYTDDDGKSYFGSDELKIVPFDHNGKQAVRAHVGKQEDGVTRVIWMERLKPEAKVIVTKVHSGQPMTPDEAAVVATGLEVKAVGDAKWQVFSDNVGRVRWMSTLKGSDGKTPIYLGE